MSVRTYRYEDQTAAKYYADVGKVEILDANTERVLFERYKKNGDVTARNKIIESALRFVVKLARKYARDSEMTKDLISAGNVGLMKALDRYELNRGTRFLSYATSWVLLEIRNELYNSRLVSMPLWRQKALHRVRKVHARTQAKEGVYASPDELCAGADLSPEQLRRLSSFGSGSAVSLQAPRRTKSTTDDGTNCLANILKANSYQPDCSAMDTETREMLHACISTLPTVTEQFVVKAYFGWQTEPLSLKQIGNVLFFTSERVRQIKEAALNRLRRRLKYCLQVESLEDVNDAT